MNLDAASLFGLAGKTVVLTGAAGYLGRTIAEALLANGARIVALGRSDRLHEYTRRWASRHGDGRVRAVQVDMYDTPALEAALDSVAAEETIDVLVNNAHELGPGTGFNVPNAGAEGATREQWMANLTGGVYWAAVTSQKLGPGMKARGRGSIVNVSTMYAVVAPDPRLYEGTAYMNPPGYSASKAALVAYTRYLASFWGEFGVRANAILPGPFSNTQDDGANSVRGPDPFLDRLRARTCLRRIGKPEELAGTVLFLASDASSYMTGQSLIVDGGWTVT